MKLPRRLDDTTSADPFRKLTRAPLRYAVLPEARFRELEQQQPELIAVEDDAVLAALPQPQRIDLVYGFPNRDSFARLFPDMLARLLPAIVPEDAPLGLFLRFIDAPARPYVEPVLTSCAFELNREWMRMELVELPADPIPGDALVEGFILRPARPDDADAIVELDAVAFPSSFTDAQMVRDQLAKATVLRMLEDTAEARAVGFLRLRGDEPGAGYVSDIALHPDYHRRGLGEAMMRWALAWFRSQEYHRAALTVNVDNAPAIALYRKLGFAPGQTGLDYRRPIDEDEVRRVLDKYRTEHIRVRRRL